jgi:D-amino peptidase
LTDQIVQQFISSSRQGLLVAGTRLPSIRQCADRLGVSPYTVVIAYDRLIALGLVLRQASSGFFVASVQGCIGARVHERCGADGALDAIWLARSGAELDDDWVAAGSGQLPGHWLDEIDLAQLLKKITVGLRKNTDFTPVQGAFALREALSLHLQQESISFEPNRIVTTAGATQALDLICRTLLRRGDTVVVENPTCPMLLDRLRVAEVEVVGIDRTRDGIDLGTLDARCRVQPPRMVFVQSALHDPTGWNSSLNNILRLLDLANRHRFLVAEDDTHGDLVTGFSPRLAQFATLENLVYYRSFSKGIGSVARLGFIAGQRETIDALIATKIRSGSADAGIDGRVVLEPFPAPRIGAGERPEQPRRPRPEVFSSRRGLVSVGCVARLCGRGPARARRLCREDIAGARKDLQRRPALRKGQPPVRILSPFQRVEQQQRPPHRLPGGASAECPQRARGAGLRARRQRAVRADLPSRGRAADRGADGVLHGRPAVRILVSADIEGVAGVFHADQTQAGKPEHERARQLMTAEVNAVVAGALAGGATDVLVNDSHGTFRNLLPELLHPAARVIQGKYRVLGMMSGLEDTVDGVMLLGYHGRSQGRGILAHTINSFAFARVWFNGIELGEAGIYGALADEWRTPVLLASGDDVFVEENRLLFPSAEFVAVKSASGHGCGTSLSPSQACTLLAEAARRAVGQGSREPGFGLRAPIACRLQVNGPAIADLFCQWPSLERIDGVTLEFVATSVQNAVRMLNCMSSMSSALR